VLKVRNPYGPGYVTLAVGDVVCVEDLWSGLESCNGMTGVLREIREGSEYRFVVELQDLDAERLRLLRSNATNRKYLHSCLRGFWGAGWNASEMKPKPGMIGLGRMQINLHRPQMCSADWQVHMAGPLHGARIPGHNDGTLVKFGHDAIYGIRADARARTLWGKHGRVYAILRKHREKNDSEHCFMVLVGAFEVECEDSQLVSEAMTTQGPMHTDEHRAWMLAMETTHQRKLLCCKANALMRALDPMPLEKCHGDEQLEVEDFRGGGKHACFVLKDDRVVVHDTWASMEALVGLAGTVVAVKVVKTKPRRPDLKEYASRFVVLVRLDGPLGPKQTAALSGRVASAVNGAYKTWIDSESLGVMHHPLLLCDGYHVDARCGAASKRKR
jgi:hypothetical protein